MRIIDTIEGEPITERDDGSVTFRAKAAIDTDGQGDLHGDPDAQADTSLHRDGKPLNADEDLYIVTPPAIIAGVKGIVLGCLALVNNTRNGRSTKAVVGDIGPHRKIGEISRATAMALGIDPSPTRGGEDAHVIEYILWPGVAANVNGVQYALKSSAKAFGAGDEQSSPAPVESVPAPSGTLARITDHWFDGVKREPFPGGDMLVPECVVEHFTSGASGQSSVDFWREQNNGVLAHVVIERDGTIIQCRPFNRTCGHAGVSRWVNPKTGVKRVGLNQYAIGIEIANAGDSSIRWAQQQPGYSELRAVHRNGGQSARWEVYPDAQIASVKAATAALVAHYGLADVTGHDCIAPERKSDPGPAFPMEEIRGACGFSGLPAVHEP